MTPTLPTGIHNFQSRPMTVEACEWVPNDPFQRGAVLGWLTGNGIDFRIVNPTDAPVADGDWIHLLGPNGNVFDAVGPGDIVVFERDSREIASFNAYAFDERFEARQTINDPHQPSLLDLLEGLGLHVLKHA